MRFQNLRTPITLVILFIFFLSACQPKENTSNPSLDGPKKELTTSILNSGNLPMNKPSETLNIAHRGARSLAPENTLVAARKGLEIGANLWELDVAMTKDGELVILHDATLERTSNGPITYSDRRPWNVFDFTFDELRKLDFGSWYNVTDPFKQISGGIVSKDDQQKYIGEKIPTLREALTLTKNNQWKVNVEIKDQKGKPGDATIVEKVIALVGELGMEKSVIISSFNWDYLVRSKKANPTIKTAVLTNAAETDPLATVEKLGADAFNPNFKFTYANQVEKLRAAGKDVYVWTVNDEATMKSLIGMGVSGIITDFPQLLKTVLASYPK